MRSEKIKKFALVPALLRHILYSLGGFEMPEKLNREINFPTFSQGNTAILISEMATFSSDSPWPLRNLMSYSVYHLK